MIVNVTTLGSGAAGVRRSVGNIVNYLEGRSPADDQGRSRPGSSAQPLDPSGPGAYYADSGSGRWIGHGTEGAGFALSGQVGSEQFMRLLLGVDPNTGERLMHARGVSARSNSDSRVRSVSPGQRGAGVLPGLLSGVLKAGQGASSGVLLSNSNQVGLSAFAAEIGVAPTYLAKVIRRTNSEVEAQREAEAAGLPVPVLSATHLRGNKEGKTWLVDRAEADRFAASRKPQQVVHGYDVTFSVQKSVSVLWAASSSEVQRVIEDGFTHAVATGMAYLEDEGFWVRHGRSERSAGGMTAAAYRHHTSRALEPQLHDHVVIPNMAWTVDGEVRAVDARGLLAHATTASHLANAALRNYLSTRLGVEWTIAESGRAAEIEGVPVAAMKAMSSRRAAVVDLAEEVGAFTARGRQVVALMTRPSKEIGVDGAELAGRWSATLAAHGLTPDLAAELTTGHGQVHTLDRLGPDESDRLFASMSSEQGVTKYSSVFDRRDAIAFVADNVGTSIDAVEICRLADEWLATAAVPLEGVSNSWEYIGKPGARVALSHDTVYSTPEIIRIEQLVLARHQQGLDRDSGGVDPGIVERAIRKLEDAVGHELGSDQAAAIRSITQSGHQFQAVEGLAGAGKTTAMSAAVDSWQSAGYQVVGAAPFGAAARKLEDEIGIPTRTVAGLLEYMKHDGPDRVLDSRTVCWLMRLRRCRPARPVSCITLSTKPGPPCEPSVTLYSTRRWKQADCGKPLLQLTRRRPR